MKLSGWWFQPIWKMLVKLDHFRRSENKNISHHYLTIHWKIRMHSCSIFLVFGMNLFWLPLYQVIGSLVPKSETLSTDKGVVMHATALVAWDRTLMATFSTRSRKTSFPSAITRACIRHRNYRGLLQAIFFGPVVEVFESSTPCFKVLGKVYPTSLVQWRRPHEARVFHEAWGFGPIPQDAFARPPHPYSRPERRQNAANSDESCVAEAFVAVAGRTFELAAMTSWRRSLCLSCSCLTILWIYRNRTRIQL